MPSLEQAACSGVSAARSCSARSKTGRITSRWPRWTPSKLPNATNVGVLAVVGEEVIHTLHILTHFSEWIAGRLMFPGTIRKRCGYYPVPLSIAVLKEM